MATRVASLFAEIGVQDKASDALKAINQYLIETHGYAGLAATAVITAGAAAVAGLNAAKDAAQEYDQAVFQMSLTTGTSAQATSRLIQVMDDAGISQETLTRALKIGVKNGVEPSIEGLAALSDQYLALAPGIDRDNFLLEKFGRNGLEMARAMVLGGDALRQMNTEIDAGLVVTAKAIRESEEYRKNVDELNDAWQAFKVSLGNDVIPVLNDTIDANKKWAATYQEIAKETGNTDNRTLTYLTTIALQKEATMEATVAAQSHGEALDGVTKSTIELVDAQAVETEALDMVEAAISGDFREAWESYEEGLGRLQEEQSDLNEELSKAERWYGVNSEKAQELRDKLADNAEAQNDLKSATDSAVRAMIYQSTIGKADAATQLELGRALGLVSEEDYNIARATQAIIDQGTPDFVDPAEVDQLKSLADNILKMKGENVPITFDALISASIVDKEQVGELIANQVAGSILGRLGTSSFYTSLNSLTHGDG